MSETASFEARVAAIRQLGYTRGESEFMAIVTLHSGFFVRRQYHPDRGKADAELVRKLCIKGDATLVPGSGREQVIHIHSKRIYRALGQDDNRHRRPHESFYIRAKLMLLDYVLANRPARFLPTEDEKVAYFRDSLQLPVGILPNKVFKGNGGTTTRYFVDKFPIKIVDGRVSFGFIHDGASRHLFRRWLSQLAPLLAELASPEVVFITASVPAAAMSIREFRQEFGGGGDGMAEYFALRKDIAERGMAGRSQAALNRYRELGRKYSSSRCERAYAEWSTGGGLSAADVAFSSHLLPHRYGHFGSLAGDESNVGIAKESDTIDGACACFGESAERDRVRIAFSSRVPRRASELRAASILGYIPGSAGTVEWLHRHFAADRLEGDWFRASVELRTFIGAVAPLQVATRARRQAAGEGARK